ncbi:putative 3-methyladenine DNA glycosylase [Flexivirga endophytica]|uniref:Putative 3-methyladenine DNA glycosylase n=1 Tax=Flexivirga endophytica TaxID=1849103 RepID=A0A916TFD8_9MICO|nr:DNA-3-methyladenine glycosylase [Flexivirga endophytica]GGB42403.1 putative 3-methyladenine DNA glycosylase [Flexivirga endophytica]GHB70566.1 putative 3-methyladenine DNA glycosylase [Flexivirga endophytica]
MPITEPFATAHRLLGAHLIGRGVTARITEVEAYDGANDPGSHAFRGRTPRNEVMFGPAGHLYCYFSYGMHVCCNYVCGPDGRSAAVLLRAAEILDGIELARERRGGAPDRNLGRGPACLTQALGIRLSDNGTALHDDDSAVRVEWRDRVPATSINSGPRVGVSGAGGDAVAYPWRFWIDGDPTVSAYRAAKPRRRRTD